MEAEVVYCVKFISYKAMFLASGLQFHFEGANSRILTLWECSIVISAKHILRQAGILSLLAARTGRA